MIYLYYIYIYITLTNFPSLFNYLCACNIYALQHVCLLRDMNINIF